MEYDWGPAERHTQWIGHCPEMLASLPWCLAEGTGEGFGLCLLLCCLVLGSQPVLVGDNGSCPSSPLAHPNSSWLFVPRAGDLGGPGVQRAEGWALTLLFPREPLALSGTLPSPVPGAGEGPGEPVIVVELGDTCVRGAT